VPIKIISLFFGALLVAAFAVGVLNNQFLELAPVQAEEILGVMPGGASAACGEDEFRACMEGKTSELNACSAACPVVEKPCQPGDPPGATCYGSDMNCVNACSSAAQQECRTKTTCPPDASKSSSPPPSDTRDIDVVEDPITKSLKEEGGDGESSNPPTADEQTVHTVDDAEFIEETESLAGTKPEKATSYQDDFLESEREQLNWDHPPKGLDYAVVKELTGSVKFQLRSQKDWKDATVGMKIRHGSIIQTDFDSTLVLDFEGIAVVKVEELTQVGIENFIKNRPEAKAAMVLDVHLGDMNLDVNPGTFSADVQIRAGNNSGSVQGTHFGVAYNPDTDVAVYEIYDGTIRVTSEKTGKTVVLSSSYDKPIKRVEIPKSGEFVYKTATPKDEWQARQKQASSESKEKKTPLAFWALAVVGFVLAIGVGLIFYRKKLSGK